MADSGPSGRQGGGVVIALVAFAVLLAVGGWLWWMVTAGFEGAQRTDDPRTTVVRNRTTRPTVTVSVDNLGPGTVVVGCSVHRLWSPLPGALVAPLVVRSARWGERRRPDRGADRVIGTVEGLGRQAWAVPVDAGAVRVRVVIGRPGRLRVHDHRLPAGRGPDGGAVRATGAGWRAGRP